MNGNSVGKYVPGNSIIHRLDPRIKLIANIIFIVLVFLTTSFILEGIILAPIILAFLLTNLKKRQILKMLKPVIFIGVFLFIINIFIMDGNTSYYQA